ncbi:3590_t:CDS:2, partial [Entrophospora sp. SA101]
NCRPEGSLLCNRIVIASPPKNPEEEIIREIAKRILQNRYGFSEDQVNALFSIQKNGSSHSVTTSDKNGDTSDSDTNPDTNTEPEPKSQPKNYNPFDAQIAEIDSMLAEM